MKITHLSHSNSAGGAANFVSRVIESVDFVGMENELLGSSIKTGFNKAYILSSTGNESFNLFKAKVSQTLDRKLRLFESTKQKTYKSPNLIGALRARNLNKLNNDLFHLHWVNGGLISIRQIGKIDKPIIWTMLDMWPFLGSEHYLSETDSIRFISGYGKHNRPPEDKGLDLCRISWSLKSKYFKNISLVSPSKWLASQARSSAIFNDHKIEIIPPPINTNQYSPSDKKQAKFKFKINDQSFIVGFLGGVADRKGWKFIKELCSYPDLNPNWKFLLAGAPFANYSKFKEINRTSILAGNIESISDLVSFYSSIDVLIVPSVSEAYGLVAQEAQSCGVPVITFSDTGTEDIVINNVTGYIVKQRSANGLLDSIKYLNSLSNEQRTKMSIASRTRAIEEWNYKTIGDRYFNFYSNVLDKKLSNS